jgi:hypothetical protein
MKNLKRCIGAPLRRTMMNDKCKPMSPTLTAKLSEATDDARPVGAFSNEIYTYINWPEITKAPYKEGINARPSGKGARLVTGFWNPTLDFGEPAIDNGFQPIFELSVSEFLIDEFARSIQEGFEGPSGHIAASSTPEKLNDFIDNINADIQLVIDTLNSWKNKPPME